MAAGFSVISALPDVYIQLQTRDKESIIEGMHDFTPYEHLYDIHADM